MAAIYRSEDGEIVIDGDKITVEQFNKIMTLRGCPVRVDIHVNKDAAMLAAWDWLAHKVERLENGQKTVA
jgi:hypothetical protein